MVRPVIFLAYSGEMRWRTRAGDEITATLGTPMTKDQSAQAWRTALDPAGEWVSRVLEAADKRLTEVRRGMPDAAGLVIAGDHEDARAYAGLLRGLTGRRPVVVLSDDKAASRKISAFASSDERWMVAVRMVSEGVDIPRLAVGVYATSVSTALFFAQAVGRFVRVRQRGETASVFLPSVPLLLSYAAELEAERDHVLRAPAADGADEELLLAEAQRERDTPDTFDEPAFQALNASAHFDRVLYDGGEFGTATAAGSPEEEDFLGLPGLLDPDQVRTLLRKRQDAQLAARSAAPARPPQRPCPPQRPRRAAGEPPGPRRAAEGTQRPGRGLESPDRPAARGHPRRTAPHLRRPAAAPGHRGADPRPHRDDPPLGHLRPLAVGVSSSYRGPLVPWFVQDRPQCLDSHLWLDGVAGRAARAAAWNVKPVPVNSRPAGPDRRYQLLAVDHRAGWVGRQPGQHGHLRIGGAGLGACLPEEGRVAGSAAFEALRLHVEEVGDRRHLGGQLQVEKPLPAGPGTAGRQDGREVQCRGDDDLQAMGVSKRGGPRGGPRGITLLSDRAEGPGLEVVEDGAGPGGQPVTGKRIAECRDG